MYYGDLGNVYGGDLCLVGEVVCIFDEDFCCVVEVGVIVFGEGYYWQFVFYGDLLQVQGFFQFGWGDGVVFDCVVVGIDQVVYFGDVVDFGDDFVVGLGVVFVVVQFVVGQ